jgi:hypothetical protein
MANNFLSNEGEATLEGPTGSTIIDPWDEASASCCTYQINGENMMGSVSLDSSLGQVDSFPTTAADYTLSCDPMTGAMDGQCGRTDGGSINALIISGETTDAPITVADGATGMPDPVGTFATFQCAFLGLQTGTIPEAAVEAILGTNPTRIQTQVIIAGGTIASNPNGEAVTNILLGHAVVGFTDL